MAFSASIKTEQRASSQAVDVQAPIGSVQSPAPPVPRLSGYALDPRPDLADDHWYWVAVLAEAWIKEHPDVTVAIQLEGGYDTSSTALGGRTGDSSGRSLCGLLHGLRCGGAELQKQRNRSGKEFLRLIYKPLLGPGSWDEDKLLKDWLQPVKDEMRECFEAALATYEIWEEMQAEDAADKATERAVEKAAVEGMERSRQIESVDRVSEPEQASLFRPA